MPRQRKKRSSSSIEEGRPASPFDKYCGINRKGKGLGREAVVRYVRELRGHYDMEPLDEDLLDDRQPPAKS